MVICKILSLLIFYNLLFSYLSDEKTRTPSITTSNKDKPKRSCTPPITTSNKEKSPEPKSSRRRQRSSSSSSDDDIIPEASGAALTAAMKVVQRKM